MGALLDQALSLDNLRSAWNAVADNQGIPGADNISVKRWQRNWEERLIDLRDQVHKGKYSPARLRLRQIPKLGGLRTLRIPTVTDRVLMRAVLQVLHPICDPKFLDCSYGYRPGRGLREAVQKVLDLREAGFLYVLDADIDDFFDSVNHALLLRLLEEYVRDQAVLDLISAWVAIGGKTKNRAIGIAMGSPLSPLLANIYLHPMDASLCNAGFEMVRYADDFIVLCQSRNRLDFCLPRVAMTLVDLFLRLNPEKTRLTSFSEGFDFLGVHFKDDKHAFIYLNKRIESDNARVDWLFSDYFPKY